MGGFWTEWRKRYSKGSGSIQIKRLGGGAAAEGEEHGGGDHEIEQGGGDQSAHDDDGDGMEDFLAGFVGREEQGDQRGAGGEQSLAAFRSRTHGAAAAVGGIGAGGASALCLRGVMDMRDGGRPNGVMVGLGFPPPPLPDSA